MAWRTDTGGRVITGLLLILLGVVFLLDNVEVIDVGSIGRFWPVALILLGLGRVMTGDHRAGGAWLLFLGALLLLHTLDYFRLRESWPLFVVFVGLGIVWRAVSPNRCACPCETPRPRGEK